MGAGKSYLGKALADLLEWDFLDLDGFLETEESRSISNIFEEDGETHFRLLEQKYLKQTHNFHNYILATGGGAPCFFDNMDWMNQQGLTIYLDTPPSILASRLKMEKNHRPLLAQKSDAELLEFIEAKLSSREQFYRQAKVHFEIQTGFEQADVLLEAIKSI